jgi:hypothetical protein
LYGYCLMSNHIHLLLRPHKESISRRGGNGGGRRMSIGRPTRRNWPPSAAAARRGCPTAPERGPTVSVGG